MNQCLNKGSIHCLINCQPCNKLVLKSMNQLYDNTVLQEVMNNAIFHYLNKGLKAATSKTDQTRPEPITLSYLDFRNEFEKFVLGSNSGQPIDPNLYSCRDKV